MQENWLTKKFIPLLRFVLIPVICVAFMVFAQEQLVPDNPLKGRFVFEQKGCINCHSIKGQGGDVGPDLGDEKFYGSFLELAGIMLNHAPEMLRRMRELDLPYPEFSRAEMAELIAYLYYLRYLGEPGNLYRGKVLVGEKGCLVCHSIRDKGGNSGPAFDKLSRYISPLYMAQALWNHGPEMEKEIQKKGLKRPRFESGEIVDLSAYIREASRGSQREQVYMSPGNPQQGKTVFINKNCVRCHTLNNDRNGIGADLADLDLDLSVTEIAGLMWNHGAEMAELMKEQDISWPKFNGKEMADLIAYLYFLKFEDKPGDPLRGHTVFIEKGCTKCHGNNGKGSDMAPDISQSKAVSSSIDMAQILWNHTPVMEEKITEKVMNWPEFSGKEMIDLFAFFRSLVLIKSEETMK